MFQQSLEKENLTEGYATKWVPKNFPILKNILRKKTSLVCANEYYNLKKIILTNLKSGECRRMHGGLSVLTFPVGLEAGRLEGASEG